ncbi:MAG: radical SAM protein [Elusimicrobia bacterium]|nr:radical SAM protein [Elusimicrobiota bacterium]
MDELKLYDIFYSIQGETSLVGKPAVFVRLAGCNLNCSWCDTDYARRVRFSAGVPEVISRIEEFGCPLVVITGGEPLIQPAAVSLIEELLYRRYSLMIETNGSMDIAGLPQEVKIILDMKTPSSGETGKMDLRNLKMLRPKDELKFVISDMTDFFWSRDLVREHDPKAGEILFSPEENSISFEELGDLVKEYMPSARIQPNIHKIFAIK